MFTFGLNTVYITGWRQCSGAASLSTTEWLKRKVALLLQSRGFVFALFRAVQFVMDTMCLRSQVVDRISSQWNVPITRFTICVCVYDALWSLRSPFAQFGKHKWKKSYRVISHKTIKPWHSLNIRKSFWSLGLWRKMDTLVGMALEPTEFIHTECPHRDWKDEIPLFKRLGFKVLGTVGIL